MCVCVCVLAKDAIHTCDVHFPLSDYLWAPEYLKSSQIRIRAPHLALFSTYYSFQPARRTVWPTFYIYIRFWIIFFALHQIYCVWRYEVMCASFRLPDGLATSFYAQRYISSFARWFPSRAILYMSYYTNGILKALSLKYIHIVAKVSKCRTARNVFLCAQPKLMYYIEYLYYKWTQWREPFNTL